MNTAVMDSPGSGVHSRYRVHGHEQVVATAAGVGLPGLPNHNDIRRVVVRPTADITFTLDGSDPTATEAMYMKEDEIVVLDTDPGLIRLAGADVDTKLIYLGL